MSPCLRALGRRTSREIVAGMWNCGAVAGPWPLSPANVAGLMDPDCISTSCYVFRLGAEVDRTEITMPWPRSLQTVETYCTNGETNAAACGGRAPSRRTPG